MTRTPGPSKPMRDEKLALAVSRLYAAAAALDSAVQLSGDEFSDRLDKYEAMIDGLASDIDALRREAQNV